MQLVRATRGCAPCSDYALAILGAQSHSARRATGASFLRARAAGETLKARRASADAVSRRFAANNDKLSPGLLVYVSPSTTTTRTRGVNAAHATPLFAPGALPCSSPPDSALSPCRRVARRASRRPADASVRRRYIYICSTRTAGACPAAAVLRRCRRLSRIARCATAAARLRAALPLSPSDSMLLSCPASQRSRHPKNGAPASSTRRRANDRTRTRRRRSRRRRVHTSPPCAHACVAAQPKFELNRVLFTINITRNY